MRKVFIKTIGNVDLKRLWSTPLEKEQLRRELNEYGFYTLHGFGDTLDVYAIEASMVDVKLELSILAGIIGIAWWMS